MATVFEEIAARTSWWIEDSWRLNVRIGEETLTDVLSLQIFKTKLPWIRLFQTTKAKETEQGTDLEILVRVSSGDEVRLALQAKKLYSPQDYKTLGNPTDPDAQINVLETYALHMGAVPLYLMYNSAKNVKDPMGAWHCGSKLDLAQLGCTIVPSWRIRAAMNARGKRKFDFVHKIDPALPWRCVFLCDCESEGLRGLSRYLDQLKKQRDSLLASDGEQDHEFASRYADLNFDAGPKGFEWPDWIWTRDTPFLSQQEFAQLSGRRSGFDQRFVPKSVILIDESRRPT